VIAPPISYQIDGIQYLSILTGAAGGEAGERWGVHGRVTVFKLGGNAVLEEPPERDLTIPEPPPLTADAADLERGRILYGDICRTCHGREARGGAGIPDLRQMSPETHETFLAIVLGGAKQANGMASFADLLSVEDANRVHQYVISRAAADRLEMLSPSPVLPEQ
jgi:quinohemoprotein ethanol dehydrogenase